MRDLLDRTQMSWMVEIDFLYVSKLLRTSSLHQCFRLEMQHEGYRQSRIKQLSQYFLALFHAQSVPGCEQLLSLMARQ